MAISKLDNNQLEKYPSFRRFWGIFWSENRVIFDRKQGIFGKGVKFDFSLAALQLDTGNPRHWSREHQESGAKRLIYDETC